MITPEQLCRTGSESGHGKALCCWAAMNIEKYPELKWLTHIPNGGYRDAITANNLKAEGVRPGVPDYLLAIRCKLFSGLWIELKRPAGNNKKQGTVSAEQWEWIHYLREQNFAVHIAYGWEQARDIIVAYLENRIRNAS